MKRLPFVTPADVARAIPEVVAHLRAGGLIAYPTETVYGLGCLIRPDALAELATLKAREPSKPFLLLVRQPDEIAGLVWSPAARKLAAAFWPGALTLALPVQGELPARILSEEGTVAVRATPHEGVRALLAALAEPITSTSANSPGDAPAVSADEVAAVLNASGRLDVLILDGGALPASAPSTLVDCAHEPPRVVRAGAITTEAITQVVEVA